MFLTSSEGTVRAFFVFMLMGALPVLAFPANGLAHALTGRQVVTPAPVVLEFSYSTGDRPAYEAVEVFSPDDGKVEYQNGRTDREGRFAFTPDKPGEWRVIVKDTMGHRVELPVQVTAIDETAGQRDGQRAEAASGGVAGSMGVRALLGVSLLLNVFAGLAWFRSCRRRRL